MNIKNIKTFCECYEKKKLLNCNIAEFFGDNEYFYIYFKLDDDDLKYFYDKYSKKLNEIGNE